METRLIGFRRPRWSPDTERPAEAEAVSSVGSKGDRYDNALAESVNGRQAGPVVERTFEIEFLDAGVEA